MSRAILVEDNSLMRQTLENIFRFHFSSVELMALREGRHLIEQIKSFSPELVLLSLKLPGENSLEMTRKIKTLFPDILVVILSSYDSLEYREAVSLYGGDYLISKEASLAEYASLIECILSTHHHHATPSREQAPVSSKVEK